jgi:hypothetical protein
MANDQASRLAAGGSAVAATAAIIAAIEAGKRVAPAGGQLVIPSAVLDAIATILQYQGAILQDQDAISAAMQQILAALANPSITVKGWPSNTPRVRIITVNCILANTAYQADTILVPDGMGLVIRSHPNNAAGSLIYVATNQAEAVIPAASYPLQPSELVVYNIQDAKAIWVSSTVPGSIVVLTAEQE